MLKNPQFVEELQAQLATYQIYRGPTKRNVVEESKLKTEAGIHVGTKGIGAGDTSVDEENVVRKGAELTAVKDIHIGNDYTSK